MYGLRSLAAYAGQSRCRIAQALRQLRGCEACSMTRAKPKTPIFSKQTREAEHRRRLVLAHLTAQPLAECTQPQIAAATGVRQTLVMCALVALRAAGSVDSARLKGQTVTWFTVLRRNEVDAGVFERIARYEETKRVRERNRSIKRLAADRLAAHEASDYEHIDTSSVQRWVTAEVARSMPLPFVTTGVRSVFDLAR